MNKILKKISEITSSVQGLDFAKNKTPQLPKPDVIRLVEDYLNFLKALIYCKEIACREYDSVTEEVRKIGSLDNEVQLLLTRLREVEIPGYLNLGKNQPNQKKSAAQLQSTINLFARSLKDAVRNIQEKTLLLKDDLTKFKVVLFGKTKVGKSTVREALTRGSGESIGKGGQSTTQEIHDYTWYNLKVYDTPGSLSVRDKNKDGTGIGEEERMAHDLLLRADIALFMFTSDNIEQAELKYLNEICAKGKDILVLLNVKADISDYRMFKLRRKEREVSPEAQTGNFARISSAVGNRKVEILPIHAQAAFYSRGHNPELDRFFRENEVSRIDLYELSRFGEIRNRLVKNILERGAAIRVRTIREYFISQVEYFAQKNSRPIDSCLKQTEQVLKLIRKTKQKVERCIASFKDSLGIMIATEARELIDTYDIAETCIENKYGKDTIQGLWNSELQEKLPSVPEKVLQNFMAEIREILEEMSRQVEFIIETNADFSGLEAYSLPWADIMKFGGITSGLLATAAAFGWIPGGGWAVAGLALLGAALGFIAGLFKSKATKIRELEEKFDECLDEAISSLAGQVLKVCEEQVFPSILGKIDEAVNAQQALIHICRAFADLNQSLFRTASENREKLAEREARLLSDSSRSNGPRETVKPA